MHHSSSRPREKQQIHSSRFLTRIFYIKIDIVTVKTPNAITSYQDILDDPQVQPFIVCVHDEYVSFKTASEESVKGRIWDRLWEKGLDTHIMEPRHTNTILAFADPTSPLMTTKELFSTPANVGKYLCGFWVKETNRRSLYVTDSSEMPVLSAFVMNSLTSKVVTDKYKILRSTILSKICCGNIWQSILVFSCFSLISMSLRMNQRILLLDAQIIKPDTGYFMPLFVSHLVLRLVSFLLLPIRK